MTCREDPVHGMRATEVDIAIETQSESEPSTIDSSLTNGFYLDLRLLESAKQLSMTFRASARGPKQLSMTCHYGLKSASWRDRE